MTTEMTDTLFQEAERLVALARARGATVTFAESCTGGLAAAALTSVAGSSEVFRCGFVTYADAAKTGLLGVSPATLRRFGAVSEETARAMALGARSCATADMAAGITGVAGPDGGSEEKPVGLVCFGFAFDGGVFSRRCQFAGTRAAIRAEAATFALAVLRERMEEA